jgi:hypothetical protein
VAVKRILRYLVHTPNLGLSYPKGSKFDLLGYSDSDYATPNLGLSYPKGSKFDLLGYSDSDYAGYKVE